MVRVCLVLIRICLNMIGICLTLIRICLTQIKICHALIKICLVIIWNLLNMLRIYTAIIEAELSLMGIYPDFTEMWIV